MREIKFRAWDSKYKLMRLDMTYAMAFDGTVKLLSKYKDNESGQYHSCGNGIIPMQSTGLKDKNGKEIYEGDIVTNQHGIKFEIVWDKNALGWQARLDMTSFNCVLKPNVFEVIGNVYENSELLNES